MNEGSRALRALLARPGPIIVPECYNPITARLVERAGFSATYIAGSVVTAMHLALPDHGLLTAAEMSELIDRVVEAVAIPVIADGDQGGETASNVRRAVRLFERAGAAAIHIEDTVNPKHVDAGVPNRLQPLEEVCARIETAVEARTDDDFVIIARTDGLREGMPIEQAIERGNAYAERGADVFMCIRIPPEEIDRVAEAVPIPILDINHPVSVAESTKLKIDVWAGHAAHTTALLQQEMLQELKEQGQFVDLASRKLSADVFAAVTAEDAYRRVAARWDQVVA